MNRLTWLTLSVMIGSVCVATHTRSEDHVLATPVSIDPDRMQAVFDEVKTPFKYGVVIPAPPGKMIDCPNVFRYHDRWYMVYIQLEDDPVGYTTQLATSADLLEWQPLGTILPRGEAGSWDQCQAAGGLALFDVNWGGTNTLGTFQDKYWMSYLGGHQPGYETPPLSVSLAWTREPNSAQPWQKLPEPVLRPADADARAFERDTLFKTHIMHDPQKTLGAPYVMFYNARHPQGTERIGIAVSGDMTHWKRYGDSFVLENCHPDRTTNVISGDPQVTRIGDLWVMFYFGAFWKPDAFDTFACSRDLVHWTKWDGPDLIKPSEPWDQQYAHKPWLLKHDGVVYHFYCAVGDQGRVIALATSKPLQTTK